MRDFSFPKSERLCSKKAIEGLLAKKTNASFFAYPLKIVFAPNDSDQNQVLVVVPKRLFKRAVDRNLLKRRIKEAYRLNKPVLNSPLNAAFIYIGKEAVDFENISKAILKWNESLDAQ